MKKTLGGDRLGAGKKMQVELHGYERSTHDLGYIWRSTMAAGTLVPFMCEIALPGDTFDIELQSEILTHPTVGPLFGSYKAQYDVFQAPIRLYNSLLHNNALGIGMNMDKVKFPVLEFSVQSRTTAQLEAVTDINSFHVNPSCILAYLGIRGFGINQSGSAQERTFNGIPYLAYWEIYKQYYANRQEGSGWYIHNNISVANTETVSYIRVYNGASESGNIDEGGGTPSTILIENQDTIRITYSGATPVPSQIYFQIQDSVTGVNEPIMDGDYIASNWVDDGFGLLTGTFNYGYPRSFNVKYWRYKENADLVTGAPNIVQFDLANIDTMRKNILAYNSETVPFSIYDQSLAPYSSVFGQTGDYYVTRNTQQGLGLKTYQSDMFNNWLDTEWIDGAGGISELTAIDTSGGEFTIDTLILAKKVYNMLNRIAVSGGSYDDWLDAVYAHDRYTRAESPIYCGGLSKELIFQEVVSNSETGEQPLGTLAGKGRLSSKHKGGKVTVKVDEPSYIIGIVSLTPRIDYSQGNSWHVHLQTMDDLHKPALDEIGFQELITEQMAWWDTENGAGTWTQNSAGKQPAWLNYMTNVNRTYGNFALPDNEMFMTLNRRYEYLAGTGMVDLTTYVDPSKFNFIFAETNIDAQNFWTQISVDITARRKMSAKVMPNL